MSLKKHINPIFQKSNLDYNLSLNGQWNNGCKKAWQLEKPPKKGKNFTTVVNHGGGGQQILVCEPQKSAFFRANFPKKHAEINS